MLRFVWGPDVTGQADLGLDLSQCTVDLHPFFALEPIRTFKLTSQTGILASSHPLVSCLKRSQAFKGFVRLTHVLYCKEPLHELRYSAHAVAAADVAVAATGGTHGGLSTAGVEEGWAGMVVRGWVAWPQMGRMACHVLHRLGAGVGCRSVVKVAAGEWPALNQSGGLRHRRGSRTAPMDSVA
jgi:hypothetical protein